MAAKIDKSLKPISLIFMVAAFLTVSAVALQLAGDTWLGEMATSLRIYYFLLIIVLAGMHAAARKWKIIALLSVIGIANLAPVLPLLFDKPQIAHHENLRCVQVNVENKNRNFALLLEWLATEDPDVIAVEELTPEWDAAIRKRFPSYSAFTAPRKDYYGVGLYSKATLVHTETFIPEGVRPVEPALLARIVHNNVELVLVAVHTLAPHRPDEMARRNQQLKQLGEVLRRKASAIVLLGDLNTVPWSSALGRFAEATHLRDSRLGFSINPTCCVKGVFWVPIDYCLVSPGLRVKDLYTGPSIGSDHVPLLVDLDV